MSEIELAPNSDASDAAPVQDNGSTDIAVDLIPPDQAPESAESSEAESSTSAVSASVTLDTPATQIPTELQPRFKQLQGDYTRKLQDLAEQRRSLEGERARYMDAIENLRQQPQTTPQQADALEHLYAQLDQEQQQGLRLVENAIGVRLDERLNPLMERVESLSSQLTQAQQRAEQMQELLQQQEAAALNQQIATARETYGEDVLALHANAIASTYRSLQGQLNPATQQPYTVADVAGLFSGQAAAAAQAARTTDQQTRTRAKRRTRAASTGQGDAETGSLSPAEAADQIAALGFDE